MSKLQNIARTSFCAFAFAALLVAPRAHAEDSDDAAVRLPVPNAQRPLTLPRLVVAPEADFQADHHVDGTFWELDVSASAGITDDLEMNVLVVPLELSAPLLHGVQYGETNRNFGPGAGVAYRFVRGPVEIAADLSGHLFTIPNFSGGSFTPEILVRLHANNMVRFDIDPAVTLQFAHETTTTEISGFGTPGAPVAATVSANAVRLQIPVSVVGNLTRSVALAASTGLTIYDTSEVRTSTGIPAGLTLECAIPGSHGPIANINPFFNFPYLLMPGTTSGTNTNQYQIGINLIGYLYL